MGEEPPGSVEWHPDCPVSLVWMEVDHGLGPVSRHGQHFAVEGSRSVRGPSSEEERGREIAGRDCCVAELYCAVLEGDG